MFNALSALPRSGPRASLPVKTWLEPRGISTVCDPACRLAFPCGGSVAFLAPPDGAFAAISPPSCSLSAGHMLRAGPHPAYYSIAAINHRRCSSLSDSLVSLLCQMTGASISVSVSCSVILRITRLGMAPAVLAACCRQYFQCPSSLLQARSTLGVQTGSWRGSTGVAV